MAEGHERTTVQASELEQGDEVTVKLSSRAQGHLNAREFDAVVKIAAPRTVEFERVETGETFTWYADSGYLMGYHDGLDRNSDIGKVTRVTQ